MKDLRLEVGAATAVGHVREANEDSMLALGPAASGEVVVAVADGMGGHQAGEVASAISVQALREMLGQDAVGNQNSGATPESRLAEAMRWANRSVWEAARQERANEGMGTTLVCAIVNPDGTVTIANVGDSRAYLVSPSGSRLLTTDHSWVNDQVRAGRMSEKDAETSPYRHILSRSLGVMPDVDVDVYSGLRLAPGDTLVLCSDGVSMYFKHAGEIVNLCKSTNSAQEMAECLVAAALDRGGADNATVVAVRAV